MTVLDSGGTRPPGASELALRIGSAIVLGAVALISAWIGGAVLALVWLGAAIAVAAEWVTITSIARRRLVIALLAAILACLQISYLTRGGAEDSLLPVLSGVGVLLAVVALVVVARSRRDRLWIWGGLIYAAPLAIVPVLLRLHPTAGLWLLLWMFAVVWTTDVAAYFVGRALGGPKLLPAVSPKKTWSGFVGGLFGGSFAGLGLAAFALSDRGIHAGEVAAVVALSGLASLVSQAGDLAESAMKRHFGVKDSGHLIPGHGGFMDRLDGFAAVAILVAIVMPFVGGFW
ncbi:phosphatidate cytidylyltransferase [Enterovirga rhinocerotis]|uniref:Phosphatidate cytidylyltransferase n=1 Tax=Enterovirga rhinocerotis TaxID=1339210 RepID=A0A4R7C5T6_9HYPH|nr:phosphatidate cytidylyltransferase [Enterovirga rhinocerotis]TDR93581.1 phosphatidate cytidylyltransferase [Enterovirga rhinocerotis]